MALKRKNETESEEGLTLIQLATRIPKELHKVVKVWCVTHDTSVADFTTDALRHELEARQGEEPVERAKVKAAKAARRRTRLRHYDDDDYVPSDNDDYAA